MAISTYSELKTAVADFLNRDDLNSAVENFVALGEANISRDIRHYLMESTSSLSVSSQYTSLPSDWLETIRVSVSTGSGDVPLQLLSRQQLAQIRADNDDSTGTPGYYSHRASTLEAYPSPDSTYTVTLDYFAKVPALSDSNTTNWLLTRAPDVYLYASLLHTAPYLQEDARVPVWAQLYSAAVQNLNSESEAARMSGSGLVMNTRGFM